MRISQVSIVVLGLLLASCSNEEKTIHSIEKIENSNVIKNKIPKREFYQDKMKEKNFLLETNGRCDDALEDTIHNRKQVYIEEINRTDLKSVVAFKFIDACCQEFLGDYSINQDTLKFKFESITEEVCSCICWYRYKLTINESKALYSVIQIEEK